MAVVWSCLPGWEEARQRSALERLVDSTRVPKASYVSKRFSTEHIHAVFIISAAYADRYGTLPAF
jgi:hypothetical protein